MMNFEDLLKKRRSVQFKKMSRYMKYIFNDHFVIVMFFLLGALAFQYSELLKTLPTEFFGEKFL
ncbi:ABC transporter permease [Jeotgalibaca sp. MA1X17-3]|uniref:ABC transporter permease n=1 Tax=Jeotgalibaca sp. MA1X17-3 TaxID=2908211 RepID=UPI001F1EA36E|nr:ABC transporter permease [Jeotgalibaca sp. MA1X17-3]UJF15187.1 ABC transporter permease [Jeotgalibaca sp. MA1X17-3]